MLPASSSASSPSPSSATRQALIDLETRFWQSMVDQDADAAVALLCEPAFMVSQHGTFRFDHATYRQMADQGPMVVTGFHLGAVEVTFPTENTAVLSYQVRQTVAPRGQGGGDDQTVSDTSTWVRMPGGDWRCVMHTEAPVQGSAGARPKPNPAQETQAQG